jgi:HK97 family phage major capsid protein
MADIKQDTPAPENGVEKKLESIETGVKNFTEKATTLEQNIDKTGKEVETVKSTVDKVSADLKVVKDQQDKIIEAQDKMIAERKNIHFGEKLDKESFRETLQKGLTERSEELKNYKNSRRQVDLQLKVVGDIGTANFTTTGTQTFAGPTLLPGVGGLAYRKTRMRGILGTSPVTTDSVAVIRAVAGEGGPTGVAAAAVKPQSDKDWVKVIIPITKVAHYYTIPEEWLEDVAWLANDISQTGIEELLNVEDNKIVSNAVAGEFTGLVQNSTAFAAPAGLALGIDLANNYDVLVAAATQLRNANREPNFYLTDNDSYARMILTKATTGEYVFGAPNISLPNVFGVPIFPMNVTALADKFIAGDRSQATIAVRAGITVRFYDQHANNAIYNLVTVVIEERIALVVKRTDAFVYGDFSDARTAIETA